MAVTCCIRYTLDPFKRDAFEEYARRWATIIPRCGGGLLGYFMPHEGTNNIALALISFESLAAYETYRARLKVDAEGAANSGSPNPNDSFSAKNARFCGRLIEPARSVRVHIKIHDVPDQLLWRDGIGWARYISARGSR